jgi:hypothetical protein
MPIGTGFAVISEDFSGRALLQRNILTDSGFYVILRLDTVKHLLNSYSHFKHCFFKVSL